jgi:hypothetical protein
MAIRLSFLREASVARRSFATRVGFRAMTTRGPLGLQPTEDTVLAVKRNLQPGGRSSGVEGNT